MIYLKVIRFDLRLHEKFFLPFFINERRLGESLFGGPHISIFLVRSRLSNNDGRTLVQTSKRIAYSKCRSMLVLQKTESSFGRNPDFFSLCILKPITIHLHQHLLVLNREVLLLQMFINAAFFPVCHYCHGMPVNKFAFGGRIICLQLFFTSVCQAQKRIKGVCPMQMHAGCISMITMI